MKNKIFLLLTALTSCFGIGNIKAQTAQTQYFVPASFPRSPSSTAIEKYGTYQINEFTGIPDISIPLYTVQSGKLSIPITLSYHASGNKVTDVASWTGLGWSLSAGGQVSRRTMGVPDDAPYGYLSGFMKQEGTYSTDNNDDLHWLEYASDGTYDTKPDIFSYDFTGHSGKFFFDGSPGGNFATRMLPYSSLKITHNFVPYDPNNPPASGLTSFDITDDGGNNFIFNTPESTFTSSGGQRQPLMTSAWKMSAMISQDRRDTININYASQLVDYPAADSEVFTVVDQIQQTESNEGNQYQASLPSAPTTPGNNNIVTEQLPSQINFKNGRVVFVLDDSTRQDINQGENGGAGQWANHGLAAIEIYSYNFSTKAMELQKSITFCKSYFTAGDKRLRLDSLQVRDKTGAVIQHYKFDYNQTIAMPNYYSYQQDYWGYYNGKANNMLTPQQSITYNPTSGYTTPYYVTIGSNVANGRDCDSNYMQADMLTGIHYPTGGFSKFAYETNRYYDLGKMHLAGGLRVKSISSYDSIGSVPILRTYQYNTARKNFLLDYGYFSTTQPHRSFAIGRGASNPVQVATAVIRTFVSSPHCDLEPYDAATVVYPSVTEYIGTPGNNAGKTDYTFTDQSDSYTDASFAGSLVYVSSFYARGHLVSKNDYRLNADGSYQPVKTETHTYTAFPETNYDGVGLVVKKLVYNDGAATNPIEVGETDPDDSNSFLWQYYYITSDDNYLTGTVTKDYDLADTTKSTTSFTTYQYDTHQQVAATTSINSKGDFLTTNNIYPYTLAAGNPVIDSMVSQHIWAEPIEKYETLVNDSTKVNAVVSGQLNRYKSGGIAGSIVPASISTLSVGQPLTDFSPAQVSKGNLTADSRYEKMISFDYYDLNNNILQYTPKNSTPVGIIWDYGNDKPIAQVKNTLVFNSAYTGFEADGNGSWGVSGAPVNDTAAPAGQMDYSLTSGQISSSLLESDLNYTLTYLSNNGPALVTGGKASYPGIALHTNNGWTLYRHQVPAGVSGVTLAGKATIDELRLYPANAQMTTYNYTPDGVQTITDAKNQATRFEYDNLQRLLNVKDTHGSIVKNYAYQYDNDTANWRTVYYNTLAQLNVYKSCGPDSLSTSVTYTVKAGKYLSFISQLQADSLAQADIKSNGQNYADTAAVCNVIINYNYYRDSTFTPNLHCGGDSVTFPVKYIVPYGTFTSTVSQGAADSLAMNDIILHGQAYADSAGKCYPKPLPPPPITYIPFSLSNSTDEDYQVSFQVNGTDAEFTINAGGHSTVQVPQGTYGVVVYTNGTYTNRTFTLGQRPDVTGVPRTTFTGVNVTTGSTDLSLEIN